MRFTHLYVKICRKTKVTRSVGNFERKKLFWRQLAAFYRYVHKEVGFVEWRGGEIVFNLLWWLEREGEKFSFHYIHARFSK